MSRGHEQDEERCWRVLEGLSRAAVNSRPATRWQMKPSSCHLWSARILLDPLWSREIDLASFTAINPDKGVNREPGVEFRANFSETRRRCVHFEQHVPPIETTRKPLVPLPRHQHSRRHPPFKSKRRPEMS